MSEGAPEKSKLSNWLEILQQESWQLELIISGFAIFLISSLYDPLSWLVRRLQVMGSGMETDFYIFFPALILMGAWLFLLINLIFHVLLRGLWISTIGLRYVSGEIDFDKLGLSDRFERFLRRRIKSFDLYIERLERLCSVIFSFTFLIIFSLISFGLYMLLVVAVVNTVRSFFDSATLGVGDSFVFLGLILLFFLSGLLYFIDFLTLGYIKKKKWLSKLYYPIYRFYSFITLAALYRPIYYNLIDNSFGKWVGRMIVPYILIIIFLFSIYADTHAYYPESGRYILKDNDYLDSRAEDKVIENPVIRSKFIGNGFLEVFLPYAPVRDDRTLRLICPDYTPDKKVGIGQRMIQFQSDERSGEERKTDADSAFLCLQQLYIVGIDDSTFQELNYKLYEMPRFGERGLSTIIDVQQWGRGEHSLHVKKLRRIRKDRVYQLDTFQVSNISFWIE